MSLRVLVVGASGTIGSAAVRALSARGHEVYAAHRTSATYPVDIADPGSLAALFERVGEGPGPLDAVVCAAGSAPFGPWADLDAAAWQAGLSSKLLGQVGVVRAAMAAVRPGASFTLTTGVLAREPVRGSSIASAVNAAVESWVRASALEQPAYRFNAVSPTVLTESLHKYDAAFPGFASVDADVVGRAFVRSVESLETGRIYEP
jgi:NAD(P)-dependent dehydrogenase (short-subunit alcohol dehydrogenase family)